MLGDHPLDAGMRLLRNARCCNHDGGMQVVRLSTILSTRPSIAVGKSLCSGSASITLPEREETGMVTMTVEIPALDDLPP